jgi:hypothetical protein
MDDPTDASQAIDNIVQSLRLAGVDEDVITSELLAKGILRRLMNGDTPADVMIEVEDAIEALAKHIAGD